MPEWWTSKPGLDNRWEPPWLGKRIRGMKTAAVAALGAALTVPGAAFADGLPVVGLDGSQGVVSANGAYRYTTVADGPRTVVERLRVRGATIARQRDIRGTFLVPVVAYDSATSGLSADGRTLVLIRPRRQPVLAQKHTKLLVLDATRLTVRREVTLPGDFSFDAVSPDGSRIYLINYLSLTRNNFDPANYKVRAYDVEAGRLDPAPVVDPREPGEKMGGLPVTRLMSPDGRWAYTLYQGSEHPFVHALDTVGNTARCIDLDRLDTVRNLFQLRLRLAAQGRELQVVQGNRPLALVDTERFTVSAPHPPAASAAAGASPHSHGRDLWPFPLALVPLVLLLLASVRPLVHRAAPGK